LQSAASVIPVPLLQETIGVALKIIEICEVCGIPPRVTRGFMLCFYQDASAVEENVRELQDRLCHLMVVIVDNVTATSEAGSEVVVKAVVKATKGIERDIRDLLRCAYYNSETIVDC